MSSFSPAPHDPSASPDAAGLHPLPDPRDPLGLAADAPLLAGWLSFMRRADAAELLPMSVPGHKQRRDLVGDVIAVIETE